MPCKDFKTTDTVKFNTYDLSLDFTTSSGSIGSGDVGESEMHLQELWEEIQKAETRSVKYNMLVMEFHEKFAVPFSCLILGFIGLAIGVQSKAHGFSSGIAMALGVFLVYYVLLSAVKSFGESGAIPPALGMWLPNLLLGTLAIFMFISACKERPMKSLELLNRIGEKARSLFPFSGGQKTS